MAGSIRHVTDKDGEFTFDLIDNMGDAYEACEELFDEVKRLRVQKQTIIDEVKKLKVHLTGEYWEPKEFKYYNKAIDDVLAKIGSM